MSDLQKRAVKNSTLRGCGRIAFAGILLVLSKWGLQGLFEPNCWGILINTYMFSAEYFSDSRGEISDNANRNSSSKNENIIETDYMEAVFAYTFDEFNDVIDKSYVKHLDPNSEENSSKKKLSKKWKLDDSGKLSNGAERDIYVLNLDDTGLSAYICTVDDYVFGIGVLIEEDKLIDYSGSMTEAEDLFFKWSDIFLFPCDVNERFPDIVDTLCDEEDAFVFYNDVLYSVVEESDGYGFIAYAYTEKLAKNDEKKGKTILRVK